MNTRDIQGIFAGFTIFMVLCIFVLYLYVPEYIRTVTVFVFILVACIAFTIGIKAIVLEGDRSLNEKDIGDIVLNGFIAVFGVVGTMFVFIMQRPLVGRAFENTIGYKWIDMFGLSEAINGVYQGNPGYNYNIIATQLFDDQMTVDNLKNVASMFSGVNVKENAQIEPLQELITKKRIISEATLVSLATTIAFYISYLPVWKPWIRGS